MKKNILKYALMCVMVFSMTACDDFFMVDTDNILDDKDYIEAQSEMYSGFIGIATKLQAIGDKAIYLTDTRGELLEPTKNTTSELYSIYNYDTDLTGNSYADPAPYYDVIIACNDYMFKLKDYKENSLSIDESHYEALISASLRIKAWTYLTIAKIYGEAIWFDDPLRETTDLSKYPILPIKQVVKSCLDLLDNGFDGIDGNREMIDWVKWIDPDGDQTSTNPYYYWNNMAPPYFMLYAELCLWDGQYKKTSDLILEKMNAKFKSSTSSSVDWLQNSNMTSRYGNDLWNGSSGNPYRPATLSVIIYDYKKNQTNSLLKHFSKELPNEYLLAPSEVGMDRFIDPEFNNLGTVAADNRAGATFSRSSAGSYIRKYRATDARPAYKDDTPIYIYRSTELYFFLAEALNNQGRFEEASALINRGVNNAFPKGGVTWEGFTDDWTSASSLGNRTYPDLGIRGCHNLGVREFKLAVTDEISLEEAIKFNDFAIMDEMFLEFPCEGKNYPAMVRAALRHGDFSHMAGRISEKYDNPEEIKAKIEAGGYFIKWDLTK